MFKFGKTLAVSALTASVISLSALAAGSDIPESYKFVPKDSLMSLDIKTTETAWEVIKKNKSLSKINLFKEMAKLDTKNTFIDTLFNTDHVMNFGDNLVVSLLDFNIEAESTPGIIIVEEMKNSSAVQKFKSRLTEVGKKSKDHKRQDSKFKDAEVISFTSSKGAKNDDYYFAVVNNYIVTSNRQEGLMKSLNSFYSQDLSVMSSPDFLTSFNKIGSDFQFQFFLNNKKFFNTLYSSKEMKSVMKDMNFNYDNLMASNLSLFNFRLNQKSVDITSYSTLDKNNKMGKLSLDSKPSDFKKYIRMSPKNTLFFFSASDMKNTGEILSEALPKTKDLDYGALLTEAIGVDLIEAMKNMQDDVALSIFSTEDSPIPGFSLMFTPKDRNKMVTALNSIKVDPESTDKGNRSQKANKAPTQFKFTSKNKYKDIEIFVSNEIPDLAEVNIQPAYGFLNDNMILASNETILKSILDRNNTPVAEYNLEGNESFAKLMREFGETNNGLGFINLKTMINIVTPFLQSEKSLKETLNQLKKLEAIGFNRTNDTEGSLGKFVLLADIENMEFDKIIPPDVFSGSKDRAHVASVKANMHTLQTIVETHAVDWQGLYPSTLTEMKKEATRKGYDYWKEFKNPMTSKTGIGQSGNMIDFSKYNTLKSKPESLKGLVVYQPSKCKLDKDAKRSLCESYNIYGLDEKGKLIQVEGKNFILNNDY